MVQDRIYNYFERNPELHVLFIFDKMDIILDELSQVTEWREDYHYHIFDGAWFNTKYAIENTWKEKKVVLLFKNGTYPVREEEQLKFPLLDMLKANMEYKEEDYASFMQQYNLPEKFRPFIKKNIGEIMSTKVSALLNGHISAESFSEDVVCRAFISTYLGDKKLLDWENIIVKMIILGGATDDKKRDAFFLRLEKTLDAKRAVDEKLNKLFGFSYKPNSDVRMKEIAESLKYNSITQLLDVAKGDSYKQYKVTNQIKLDLINKIYECGSHDRVLCDRFVQAMSNLAESIREEEIISTYGIDAQYFCMTEELCWPILKEIIETKLVADPAEVNDRMRELMLKLPINSVVQTVLRFVEQTALYYNQIRDLGTLKLSTPKDYVDKYLNEFYLVDTYYRRSLQAYHELLTRQNPIEQTTNKAKQQLDQDYAKITNVLNLEWLTCVKEAGAFFENLGLKKQQDFYENEQINQKLVVVISDALRYEVANELLQELAKEKHVATLSAYLSMLPTETKYCKPALLPHHSLALQGAEMAVDGQVLTTTDQRTKHLGLYKDGALCITYEDVMSCDQNTRREIFKRPLVYIFHNTIDEASHSQSPFEVISACRRAIEQLASLVNSLHASWNVTNVILTADHGFVYNDMQFEDKDKHSISEDCIEKKTRYYLTHSNQPVIGIEKFPLQMVSGMATTEDTYVAVPSGTNRLAAPGGYNFAHGGATLQEMLIPVIKSFRKKSDKTEKVDVALMSHNLNMVSSMLKFQIIQSEAVTMTVTERRIVCCIYHGDKEVTERLKLTLNSTDATNLNNRVYDITMRLNQFVNSSVLQLRIYDEDDLLNPLLKETVKNNSMEQDF